jgi:hypothetical protein
MTTKSAFLTGFLFLILGTLEAQVSFPDRVAVSFGSDQEFVNGVQFANHYGLIDGHPYFLDESFRKGSVYVNSRWYEDVKLRYNIYTQKVEIEYRTAEGHINQFMSVPEMMPSFLLNTQEFRWMAFPDEEDAYYQVISSGTSICYIGWKKDMGLAKTSDSKEYEFTKPIITYWLKLDQELVSFQNRKSFVKAFPEYMQKEIKRLVMKRKYIFKYASVSEAEAMMKDALVLYERKYSP